MSGFGSGSLSVGQKIPAAYKLPDEDSTKFIKASIYENDSTTHITGSPLTLTNLGNGRYEDDSLTFPSVLDSVSIDYEVFNEVGLTTKSSVHGGGMDKYTKLDLNQVIVLLNSLLASAPGDVIAKIEDAIEVIAKIEQGS